MLPSVVATRYVTPLREGGSLPGLMEADDLGTYVVKFVGAGQGRAALVAEVISTELARSLGLPVPALVTVDVDPVLAVNEPDQEIQSLLRASAGRNLGVDYLPGALDLDVGAFDVDPGFAGRVLWFDALIGNVDRSWRNPNMLFWHAAPYLIDHGATLTFQHSWPADAEATTDADRIARSVEAAAERPYDAAEHALLGCAPDLDAAPRPGSDADIVEMARAAVRLVPPDWLRGGAPRGDAYVRYVQGRLAARDTWLPALRAAVVAGPRRVPPRRTRPGWLR